MPESAGFSADTIVAIATGAGVFVAAMIAAFRGYMNKSRQSDILGTELRLPHKIQDQLDDIENRTIHIEHKINQIGDGLSRVYTDTQVLRAIIAGRQRD